MNMGLRISQCEKGGWHKKLKTFQVVCHEKARCTTMLTYINGEGYALPPMIIHRGKYHESWCIGAPPCTCEGVKERIY